MPPINFHIETVAGAERVIALLDRANSLNKILFLAYWPQLAMHLLHDEEEPACFKVSLKINSTFNVNIYLLSQDKFNLMSAPF